MSQQAISSVGETNQAGLHFLSVRHNPNNTAKAAFQGSLFVPDEKQGAVDMFRAGEFEATINVLHQRVHGIFVETLHRLFDLLRPSEAHQDLHDAAEEGGMEVKYNKSFP